MANKPYPLKRTSSFREVALKGRRRRLAPWLILQIMPSSDLNNYFGMTISSKVANSVVRNKLKRWVRSCVQNEKWPEKYNAHILIFVFKAQTDPAFFSKKKYSEFNEIYKNL